MSRQLEEAIERVNRDRAQLDRDTCVNKTKFKVFCATRWVEKRTTLQNFQDIYEPLLICLEAVGCLETNWDGKTVNEAFGLMKKITDSTFIASFKIVRHFFGYTKGLCLRLHGSTLDNVQGFMMVTCVKSLLLAAREDEEFDIGLFSCIAKTRQTANISLDIPR